MQTGLFPVFVENELPSTFEGEDLKVLAKGDDGHTYALKRVDEHPMLPLCEWVAHHLCRATSIRTPDFAVLYYRDGTPPAFGSRLVPEPRQVNKDPGSYEMSTFFGAHLKSLAPVYSLDAFLINCDRHGRNFMLAQGIGGDVLLAFDFSRAWLRWGEPFGNTEALRDSKTQKWWATFKRMKTQPDCAPLDKISALNDDWLEKVIDAAPSEWVNGINKQVVLEYWKTRRTSDRVKFAKLWI
jgi:hypothetical protein